MNILYIERSLVETSVVYEQICRIREHHQVSILSIDEKELPPVEGVFRVKVKRFPKIERIKSYLFFKAVLKGITLHFSEIAFDLFHAHFAYPEGLAVRRLSEKYDDPYAVTVRGSDLLIYPNQGQYLFKMIQGVMQKSSLVIGVSQYLCQRALELGAQNKAVCHIPDGFDESIFFDQEMERKNQIIFVGSLISIKNIEGLMNAFSIFRQKETSYQLLIVGSGHLKEKLQQKALELDLGSAVQFLGQLSHIDLSRHLNESKLLVLPSLSEGWGNVLHEAMGCGTPVIGSNLGGIPEIISNDNIGFLIDPKSSEDIAIKLNLAVNKDWNKSILINSALEHTKEATLKKLLEAYHKYFSH